MGAPEPVSRYKISHDTRKFFPGRNRFRWNPPPPFRQISPPSVSLMNTILRTPNRRIAALALLVYVLDQLTKFLVLQWLGKGQERVIFENFFKFVHWGNTGSAWSLFTGNNAALAVVALVALLVLFLARHHFGASLPQGQFALGLIFGGIVGNLTDRLLPSRHEVIDFIRFYTIRADGSEFGFPAFNIADSGICVGVAIVFWLSWKTEPPAPAAAKTPPAPDNPGD
jgi:signal peptidase II